MTNPISPPAIHARILRLILPIWCILIALSVVGGFMHLNASSLWLDELFTAYFSDATLPTFEALIARASEDVHPPGYYALIWAVGRGTGLDFTIAARGVSALAAALSIGLLYLAMPVWVGRPARLLGCTFAATSLSYFIYAQEARSYAVSWVLLLVLVIIAQRCMRASAKGAQIHWQLLSFIIAGIVAGLCHFYLVPIAGAFVAIMILFARRWSHRIAFACGGLLILAVMVAYIDWHADKIVADVTDTWFRADFEHIWVHTSVGLSYFMGSKIERVLVIFWFVAGGFTTIGISRRHSMPIMHAAMRSDVSLLLGGLLMATFFAILVTLFYAPSYSYRFILILAPVLWLLLAILSECMLHSPRRHLVASMLVFATLVFTIASVRIFWRDIPRQDPWRESAAFADSFVACRSSTLPVVTFSQDYISDSEPARFYGYYLANGAQRDWLAVPNTELQQFPHDPHAQDIVAQRISGADRCPILLWSVFHVSSRQLEQLRTALVAKYDLAEGTDIALHRINLQEGTPFKRLLGVPLSMSGYSLTVEHDVKSDG